MKQTKCRHVTVSRLGSQTAPNAQERGNRTLCAFDGGTKPCLLNGLAIKKMKKESKSD